MNHGERGDDTRLVDLRAALGELAGPLSIPRTPGAHRLDSAHERAAQSTRDAVTHLLVALRRVNSARD